MIALLFLEGMMPSSVFALPEPVAPPLRSLIAPDHPEFVAPADMPTAIRKFRSRTGQPAPNSEGAIISSALESLALRYRMLLGWLK